MFYCSVSSVDAGLTVLAQLPKLLQKGGFHLTKWLKKTMNCSRLTLTVRGYVLPNLSFLVGSWLGVFWVYMSWDVLEDQFKFDENLPARGGGNLPARGILSALSLLYDLLGFSSPVILLPENLLQSLCKQGLGGTTPFHSLKQNNGLNA